MLSDQLKIRTATAHQDLEKALITRMRAMEDINDYVKILQLFYTFFGAVEDRINLYIGDNELPDHLQRRKSASLITDVHSLGGLPGEKVATADLPIINNLLQAFGAMYVMEGSTLGGSIISRMIAKQLSLHDQGLSFFKSYGEQVTTMWNIFKVALNRHAENEGDAEIIITAANATFRQFKLVLDRNNY